jgi:DNA modification methylase
VWPLPTSFAGEQRPDHPTPKPIDAFGIPMRQHLRAGELCYEPFGGSGSQIIAGETYRRRVYCMELGPLYVDLIVRRWETYTGRVAVLDGDGRTFAEVQAERMESPAAAASAPDTVVPAAVPPTAADTHEG